MQYIFFTTVFVLSLIPQYVAAQSVTAQQAATQQVAAQPIVTQQASVQQGLDRIQIEGVTVREQTRMPLLLGLIKPDRSMRKIVDLLKKDLEFTKQFDVQVQDVEPLTSSQQVKQWADKGYSIVFYLHADGRHAYSWHAYQTTDAQRLEGKKLMEQQADARDIAHHLADQVWPVLTGSPGFFSSKIVYAKTACRRGRNCKKHIYVRDATDSEGESERLLVATPTISMAPRWNRDVHNPLVLYSEYTKKNVRLIAVDLQGKRRIVSNFDGINMQAAYSPDGDEVVYCLSQSPTPRFQRHTTSQLYYYTHNKNGDDIFRRLTTNHGNNLAPCWGPGPSIFYACDATNSHQPGICWHDLKTGQQTWVVQDGYTMSPSYSATTNRLAYTRMVNGIMQLWLCDLKTMEHHQLSFDASNKDDCSWSPCGNLLAYSAEQGMTSKLMVHNVLTGQEYVLNRQGEDCSYPDWSPQLG